MLKTELKYKKTAEFLQFCGKYCFWKKTQISQKRQISSNYDGAESG